LAGVATMAGAVAELLPLLGSGTALAALALLLIAVPGAVPGATVTLSVNGALLAAGSEAIEQVMVPLLPAAGVVHAHPAGQERDVNRSGAGRTSDIATLAASLGPLFVTVIVY